jgi:hypothetical protein
MVIFLFTYFKIMKARLVNYAFAFSRFRFRFRQGEEETPQIKEKKGGATILSPQEFPS